MIKKLLLTVFLVVNLFLASSVFGQTAGDYRSNVATGNWATAGSWEYYNGSTWVAAANYPGQIAGSYSVLIQAGDVINIGTSGISTATMGTLTISGSLVLTGTNTGGVGTNFIFETQTIIVTPLLGTIKFIDKVNLKLPTNATLQVKFDLTPNPDYYGLIGDCNHNQDIIIGSSTYAYCNGGGSTGLTFYEVMGGGGTLNSVPSSNSPICYGGSIMLYGSYFGPIGNGITYTWTITDPIGTSSTIIAKDSSITNPVAGNYIVKLTCSTVYGSVAYSNSETISVMVNPLPSAPSVTITQPTCDVPTATITINAVAGETYSFDGSAYSGTIVYNGLAQGTSHTVYAKSAAGCISPVTNVAINATTKTWNGSWSPSAPTSADNIIFEGTGVYNSTTDLSACSCLVKNSASVIINSGHTLTLTNELTVVDLGSIAFLEGASLLQINNVSNSGDIDYHRSTTSVRPTDYTYWSSPVSSQILGDLYPLGSTFFSYEPTATGEDWKDETAGTIMEAGKGYIANQGAVVVPSGIPSPPGLLDVAFTGVPNNGHYEINGIFADKSYLLGNPYPSALDADKFLAANVGVLEGTIYFWTHNTQIGIGVSNPGIGVYAYSADDYASYNITGGVGIAPDITAAAPSGNAANNNSIPTGKIASGQGFFATSRAAGNVVFNNDMRVSGNNSQFFKTKNSTSKLAKVIEKNRVWLNMTNTQGAFKQTLVGYITNATNDFDDRFDGESYDGNEFVDFYSVNQDKNLVIQGRALPFDENDEVPLGYRTTINGAFTISIDQVDGLLTNQAVFIEDKLTNTVFDLKSGNYTFNTVSGTFNDRFVLKYSNKTLGTNTFDSLEKTVLVSNKNKQIKINSSLEMINKVTVFDLLGRQIYQKANVNSNELSISTLVSSGQVVIVKTVLQNGQEVNNKIVY